MFQSAKCTFIRSQIEDDCDQLDGPLEIEQKLDQLFNSGCKDSLEMPVQKKDKTTIWITFSVSPIFDDKDQVAFYLCWVKTLSRGRKRGNDAALPVIKGKNILLRNYSGFAKISGDPLARAENKKNRTLNFSRFENRVSGEARFLILEHIVMKK